MIITIELINAIQLQRLGGSMDRAIVNRRSVIVGAATTAAAAAAAMVPFQRAAAAPNGGRSIHIQENGMSETRTFTRTTPPEWLLSFWREIDDKTWGKGFNCFAEDAVAHLGVSDWHGREAIRENLRAFVDKGFTAHHDVAEYWDGGSLKVFRGFVTMKPNDPSQKTVKPAMTHFFYMDSMDPGKVAHWFGSVGPVVF
ncbi:MAG TPA: nuclear transport factor 2 family protein [Steroidobacteraceae bacterium]|nr:nuclear transport factor 2 family protein [Steroidobacteraceae bacterium]